MGKVEQLAYLNPHAITLDGLDDAMVGIAVRPGTGYVAVYDTSKCIDVLMERDGMSYDEAVEYYEFNIEGAYLGDYTPIFITLFD